MDGPFLDHDAAGLSDKLLTRCVAETLPGKPIWGCPDVTEKLCSARFVSRLPLWRRYTANLTIVRECCAFAPVGAKPQDTYLRSTSQADSRQRVLCPVGCLVHGPAAQPGSVCFQKGVN